MTRPTRLLAVGRVRKPHGVHGELLVEILTDFPQRLKEGVVVGLGVKESETFATVEAVRFHKGAWLIRLSGCLTRDQAERWREHYLFLPEQEREKLPANYFYEHDLVGLRCELKDHTPVGKVVRLERGAVGVWLVVASNDRESLVPFISPIVVAVDLQEGRVILDPPEGLLFGHAL